MKRIAVLGLVAGMFAAAANAEPGCGILFGSDWAFSFSTPVRWVSRCRAETPADTALALWPQGTTLSEAPAVMSIAVKDKKPRSLALFAADEQQRLRSDKPNLAVRFEPGMSVGGSAAALVFRATDDRNHELIAYLEGPTRFFVVVLSARSTDSLRDSRGAFQSLLNSFVAMKVTSAPAK
jgi:hypothetical protein